MIALLMLACTSSPPDTGPDDSGPVDTGTSEQPLENEAILGDMDESDCEEGDNFWPLTDSLFPQVAVVPGIAPQLPYELREVRVLMLTGAGYLSGRPCNAALRVRVFAWLDDDGEPDADVEVVDGLPQFPILGEVSLTGVGDEGEEVGVATFDPPLRIEETGALMIGFEMDEVGTDTTVSCLGRCGDLFGYHYYGEDNLFGIEAGWQVAEPSPNVEIVIGY